MPITTITNEDGSQIVVPSWDGADHVRDLRSDPQAVPLRDESLPAVSGLLVDLRDHVLAHATPEQREQIITANPTWRARLRETADLTAVVTVLSDDDLAATVMSADDVTTTETAEPCANGTKERVVSRTWQSASAGYRVTERVQYQEGPDSPRCFAERGRSREVVAI